MANHLLHVTFPYLPVDGILLLRHALSPELRSVRFQVLQGLKNRQKSVSGLFSCVLLFFCTSDVPVIINYNMSPVVRSYPRDWYHRFLLRKAVQRSPWGFYKYSLSSQRMRCLIMIRPEGILSENTRWEKGNKPVYEEAIDEWPEANNYFPGYFPYLMISCRSTQPVPRQ